MNPVDLLRQQLVTARLKVQYASSGPQLREAMTEVDRLRRAIADAERVAA